MPLPKCLLAGLAALLAAASAHADTPYTDAITREITLYNSLDAQTAPLTDAITREVTLYNDLEPQQAVLTDAITREVTLFNDPPIPVPLVDAITREVTLFNDLEPKQAALTDAITREITEYMPPYSLPEALSAIHIAAGLKKATTGDMTRLDVEINAPSANRIDIADAVRVLRLAARLDP